MIIYGFFLPVKQVKNWYLLLSFNVCISNSTNWNFGCFCFWFELHIVPDFTRIIQYLQINWVSKGLKKSKAFWVSVLVETGAAEDTGRLMSPMLKMPHSKREGSLLTLDLLHNFTLVKVEVVCLTRWTFLHLVKFYSHFLMWR